MTTTASETTASMKTTLTVTVMSRRACSKALRMASMIPNAGRKPSLRSLTTLFAGKATGLSSNGSMNPIFGPVARSQRPRSTPFATLRLVSGKISHDTPTRMTPMCAEQSQVAINSKCATMRHANGRSSTPLMCQISKSAA